jgi:hypothetical protein
LSEDGLLVYFVENINLESIERHCKYKEPDKHKAEILKRLLDKNKDREVIHKTKDRKE